MLPESECAILFQNNANMKTANTEMQAAGS